jgi:GGDEF domain-containing protein
MAQLLSGCTRCGDFVAHYEMDRLAVVLPRAELAAALAAVQRWSIAAQADPAVSGAATVFWGVASALEDEAPLGLLNRAEAALDTAKMAQDGATGCHEGREVHLYAESSAPVA